MSESMSLSTEEAIAHLINGTSLHKIRSSNKFYRRKYQIDLNNMQLSYSPSRKRYLCKQIPNVDLDNISEVRIGWKTDNFNKIESRIRRSLHIKKSLNFSQDNCFSLVFENRTETIDLVAPSNKTRDLWVQALDYIITANRNQKKENQNEYYLKKQFREADLNGNGSLNLEEVIALLNRLNVPLDKKHVKFLFDSANTRKNKNQSQEEYLDEEEFYQLYQMLTFRHELNKIFKEYTYNKTSIMDAEQLKSFLEKEQKILEITLAECEVLIKNFEPEETQLSGYLSNKGFQKLIKSSCFDIFNNEHRNVCQDMSQPLSHYYIASSHNTYLFTGQLYGNSSIEGYRTALLKGCRCVEIDVWDGESEPIVHHGHTLTKKIYFRDIIKLIEEFAFKVSEYPLILSIENHCNLEQQKQMASIMISILGNFLLKTQLSNDETVWPSPEALKRKIIIKGKKLPSIKMIENEEIDQISSLSKSDELIGNNLSEETSYKELSKKLNDLSIKNIAPELSNITTYCVPKKFISFEDCNKNWKFYEMSSFVETESQHMAQTQNKEFIDYNRKHLSRIYPKGLRTDSSNYNPIIHWNVGSQLVALNYQTYSKPMLLNDALFSLNGKCGYVLKPEYLRNNQKMSDNNRSIKVTITIISGQQIPKPGRAKEGELVDPYVRLKVFGHPSDSNSFKTKFIKNNGFNPVWDHKFEFTVKFPELAFIYFVVKDNCETGKDLKLGQYILAFSAITQGYRNINLKDENNESIPSANLFVKITLSEN